MNDTELGYDAIPMEPCYQGSDVQIADNVAYLRINIPRFLLYAHENLTYAQHLLLFQIATFGNDNWCQYRNETLARRMGSTESSIRSMISRLINKGYLEKINANGKRGLLVKDPA